MVEYANQSTVSTCPVCNGNDILKLYSVTSGEAAQHFVRKEADHKRFTTLVGNIEKLWRKDSCNVNRCNSCNFCYADPYVSGDYDFYTTAHPRHGYPKWKWENQVTLDSVTDYVKELDVDKCWLLEIGAGNGAFVRRVKDVIPVEHIVCTEYSDYGVGRIREIGAECVCGDVRELDEKYNNRFSFVCLFQVLEHLDGLDRLFRKITSLTTDNAKLFIAVPNDKFIEFCETNEALLDMPPNHIGRWNPDAFKVFADKHGWRIVSHVYQPSENVLDMANRFCVYRYLKESQKSGTVANYIERISNRYIRFALTQVVSKFYGLSSLPVFIRALSKEYGMAQWVCLEKKR
ncbi:class I SAM-dependent methyltransferase [Pseudomonadota bacterium]